METKVVKRFMIIDQTDEDVSIAFWYVDGTREVVVLKTDNLGELMKNLKRSVGVNKN